MDAVGYRRERINQLGEVQEYNEQKSQFWLHKLLALREREKRYSHGACFLSQPVNLESKAKDIGTTVKPHFDAICRNNVK